MKAQNGTQFQIGDRGPWGKRRITISHNGQQLVDECNPFAAQDRFGLMARAAEQWKLDEPELESFQTSLLAATERADNGDAVSYRTYSSAELHDADFGEEWLIEGILARNHPLLVGAPAKAMKTSTMIDLLIKLAHGGKFLDRFDVVQTATCGFMTGESGLAAIKRKAQRICSTNGCTLKDLKSRLVWSDQLPKFGNLRHLEAIGHWITDNELEVMVIDPAYLCMPGANAANVAEQGELLRGMAEVCQEHGCTLGLIHHLRKPNTYNYNAPELADLAGAGYAEFAGQWLLLGRREKFDPNTGTHKLWLVVGGRSEHWGQWGLDIHEGQFPNKVWETTVIEQDDLASESAESKAEAKEAKRQREQAAKVKVARERIARAFIGMPKDSDGTKRATKNAIREAAGFSGNSVPFTEALGEMIRAGTLKPCTVKKNNRDYDGYEYHYEN